MSKLSAGTAGARWHAAGRTLSDRGQHLEDFFDGRPHLRVENRVLPAGPSVADVLFYYGLVRALAQAHAHQPARPYLAGPPVDRIMALRGARPDTAREPDGSRPRASRVS
jgi:hypothetical protein